MLPPLPAFSEAELARLRASFDPVLSESGAAEALPVETWPRLARLTWASPLYGRLLEQSPAWLAWLEEPQNLRTDYRFQALLDEWRLTVQAAAIDPADDEAYLDLLRGFRRKMSLRIAYRDVNGIVPQSTTVAELTRLAEFCLRETYFVADRRWRARLGDPWDDDRDDPARFCVLALGKMGGGELNFSSDIDVICLYEGDGHCRKEGRPTATPTAEFYGKVVSTLASKLNEQTARGFLFRTDLRLRPEGAFGPLALSLAGMENYYAAAGQTWERLAYIKARPVCGDLSLGAELLESLHSFRYPRHPPPSLVEEIAAMKARTETEVVGAGALARDVKSGFGGIREIEFLTQTFQLLHAGRYPFLQTHATAEALAQLDRYGLMAADDARFLVEAYWFLRTVEHRVQMREEQQTHELPADPETYAAVARSLGFATPVAFTEQLDAVRGRVRERFRELFRSGEKEDAFAAWWTFFTTERTPPFVAQALQRWFGDDPHAARDLRRVVAGDGGGVITRERVLRFQHLAATFDALLPRLARPLLALRRVTEFADRYGPRHQFLATCADHPQFFTALALAFDRSQAIHALLCAHPEIFEEVLRPENLRRKKSPADIAQEIAEGRRAPHFTDWLWLYVKAEQTRFTLGHLLGVFTLEEVEEGLTLLAEGALRETLRQVDPEQRLALLALGKLGGGELSYGSDLDLVAFAEAEEVEPAERAIFDLKKRLCQPHPLGPSYECDFRLRPHGGVGPMIVTPEAFADYHRSAVYSQTWERQLLTRARVIAGPTGLKQKIEAEIHRLLYAEPAGDQAVAEVWVMRKRIEHDRHPVSPPERAFKTGPGGVIDLEFGAQMLQWRHGYAHPELRSPNTRRIWRAAAEIGLLPAATVSQLLEDLAFLKEVESSLRRDTGQGVSVLPEDAESQRVLAAWLGYAEVSRFWEEYRACLLRVRRTVVGALTALKLLNHP